MGTRIFWSLGLARLGGVHSISLVGRANRPCLVVVDMQDSGNLVLDAIVIFGSRLLVVCPL